MTFTLKPITLSENIDSDQGETCLKDTMIRMSQTNRFQFKRLNIVHEIGVDSKQTLEITLNTQCSNKTMDEEEMKVLYNVLKNIFEVKDE